MLIWGFCVSLEWKLQAMDQQLDDAVVSKKLLAPLLAEFDKII